MKRLLATFVFLYGCGSSDDTGSRYGSTYPVTCYCYGTLEDGTNYESTAETQCMSDAGAIYASNEAGRACVAELAKSEYSADEASAWCSCLDYFDEDTTEYCNSDERSEAEVSFSCKIDDLGGSEGESEAEAESESEGEPEECSGIEPACAEAGQQYCNCCSPSEDCDPCSVGAKIESFAEDAEGECTWIANEGCSSDFWAKACG